MTPGDLARVADIRARADAMPRIVPSANPQAIHAASPATGNSAYAPPSLDDLLWLLDRLAAETDEVERLKERIDDVHARLDVAVEKGLDALDQRDEARTKLAAETERADKWYQRATEERRARLTETARADVAEAAVSDALAELDACRTWQAKRIVAISQDPTCIKWMHDSERLELACQALVATGYFTDDEVGPDIAPRITELNEALRETNTRLNRRAQIAEAAAQTTIDDCRRQGVSLGRALSAAGYAMRERERDEARAELAEMRARIGALCDETRNWHVYPTRDAGDCFGFDTVNDFVVDLRAALSPAEEPK